jgi:hypothetical protein
MDLGTKGNEAQNVAVIWPVGSFVAGFCKC